MDESGKTKIDPVCGMDVAGFENAPSASCDGRDFYFCGSACEERFKKTPERFLGQPLIALREVWKIFKLGAVDVRVLRGLSLHIWEGDFVAIIGASGSGKSTALNMIGLLDRPTSGEILLRGENVSSLSDEKRAELRAHTFGFVFQQYNLVPWLTAYENVIFPRMLVGKNIHKKEIESHFKEIGLGERMTHRPLELSGGEQQRVALLRALANDPKVVLGDEPTGNLDSATGNMLLETLVTLNKVQKKTLIVVTHDSDIASKADQIVALKDGRLVKDHHLHEKIYTE